MIWKHPGYIPNWIIYTDLRLGEPLSFGLFFLHLSPLLAVVRREVPRCISWIRSLILSRGHGIGTETPENGDV